MQEKELVYERIHSDFLIRLCEGEFPPGTAIPSLTDLCAQYHVGRNTMLKVLQMLREDGFIKTSPRKVGQVLFDCNDLEQYLKDLPGFICDEKILLDYYRAVNELFPAVYTDVSLMCKEKQLKEIEKTISGFHSCEADGKTYIRLSTGLSRMILSAADNQLLKKVVEITLRKTMLPALLLIGHNDVFSSLLSDATETIKPLYAALERKDSLELKVRWKKILSIYQAILEKALSFGIFPNTPSVRETDLFQEIDDEKKFIVAMSLRHKILSGEYATGESLPSIAQAKAFYRVSTVTIRNAYQILCEMGLAQTINGRGTEVLCNSGWKSSAFLEQASISRKDRYLEAVTFLEIICADVLRIARRISLSALRRDLGSPWNIEKRYSVFIMLHHLFEGTASPAVFSIYTAISNYLYWGVYLRDIPATAEQCVSNHQKCVELIDTLELHDLASATLTLMELLKTLHPRK